MKKLLICLYALLILSGCKQAEQGTEKKVGVDYFERNKECYAYKGQVEKENGIDYQDIGGGTIMGPFYSPRTNSCLYVYYGGGNPRGIYWVLSDVFNGEISTLSIDTEEDPDWKKKTNNFDSTVKDYQAPFAFPLALMGVDPN